MQTYLNSKFLHLDSAFHNVNFRFWSRGIGIVSNTVVKGKFNTVFRIPVIDIFWDYQELSSKGIFLDKAHNVLKLILVISLEVKNILEN